MEKIVLYIPALEEQFYTNELFHLQVRQLTGRHEVSSKVIYVSKEKKLYLRSVSFGSMAFRFMTLDFKNNRITFRRTIGMEDTVRRLYEIFTALQIEFHVKNMSFLIERPLRQKSMII